MYKKILVTLDCSHTDRTIVEHVKPLARQMQSKVIFLHVATSVSARYHGPQGGDQEIQSSRAYLDKVKAEFIALGIKAEAELAYGDPAKEIISWVKNNSCDLVAMATHGHQFMADLVLGTTAIRVQHGVNVPVLMLRAK